MEHTIRFYGCRGQIIFFDDEDRGTFTWACSLLPWHLKNDLRTHERCGKATRLDFTTESVTVSIETYEWTAEQIARFVVKCYTCYFCRKYKRSGKQLEYSIT